jgi:hypothetical protein
MGAAFQVSIGLRRFREIKYAIDNRFDLSLDEGAIHRLEHLATPNVNTVHSHLAVHHREKIVNGCPAGQNTDQLDARSETAGAQGLLERARTSDLNDVINSFTAVGVSGGSKASEMNRRTLF